MRHTIEPYPKTHNDSFARVDSGARGMMPTSWSRGTRFALELALATDRARCAFDARIASEEARRTLARQTTTRRRSATLAMAPRDGDGARDGDAERRAARRRARASDGARGRGDAARERRSGGEGGDAEDARATRANARARERRARG